MSEVTTRRASPRDRSDVLAVAGAALGWEDDTGARRALFAWKHDDNPFGPSPAWVAEVDGEIVGFRTFLRWRFRDPGGRVVSAVRAVDTATAPGHQGRGIFRTLTLGALPTLEDEGTAFVFNTPNDRSRPGYLSMGWEARGRLPVLVAPAGPGALGRMVRARRPAETWSQPLGVGRPAGEVLDEHGRAVSDLLASQPVPRGLHTDESIPFLRWRYGSELLGYRAVVADGGVANGVLFARVRRRGAAREAAVARVLVPGGRRADEDRLVRSFLRRADVDHALRIDGRPVATTPAVRVPRIGPTLVWRRLAWDDAAPDLRLDLGDVELF